MPLLEPAYCWKTRPPDVEAFLSGAVQLIWYTDNQDEVIASRRPGETEGICHPVPRPGTVKVRVIQLPKSPT